MRGSWPFIRHLTVVAVFFGLLTACRAAPVLKPEEEKLKERALKLNDITGDDAIRGQILTLLEDKDQTKKLLAVAVKVAKEEKEQPFSVNATYILARTAHGLKELDAAEHFYKVNCEQSRKLGSGQKLSSSFGGLIDLLYQQKRYADAEKACQDFLELRGDENLQRRKILMLHKMIQTQAKQGKTDQALKTVDNLIKLNPKNWLVHELKGWVLREAGKHDEAAKVYEEVIENINKDGRLDQEQKDEFTGDIRYTLSGVYVDLKKIDKAAEQLQALLKKQPDNPTYNNDLGFIWADHDMNLEESEKLVRKAIEEDRKLRKKVNPNLKPEDDKDNAAYLDSLGWVLYKQKKYKDALQPLLDAVKQDEGQHLEIYDHLGDVYVALGEKGKAVETYKKGMECKEISHRDKTRKVEVEKKIAKLQEDKE